MLRARRQMRYRGALKSDVVPSQPNAEQGLGVGVGREPGLERRSSWRACDWPSRRFPLGAGGPSPRGRAAGDRRLTASLPMETLARRGPGGRRRVQGLQLEVGELRRAFGGSERVRTAPLKQVSWLRGGSVSVFVAWGWPDVLMRAPACLVRAVAGIPRSLSCLLARDAILA